MLRSLQAPTFPERQGRADRGKSLLNAYQDSRVQRGHAGCRDARQVGAALRPRGYRGSDPTVARSTQRLRQAQGVAPRQRLRGRPLMAVRASRQPPLTARRGAWLGLRREEPTHGGRVPAADPWRAQPGELAVALALTADVAPLVRQRQGAPFEPWLERAAQRTLGVLQRLAQGLRDDDAAVKAGMTLSWSTGPRGGTA